ncbi:hypothetical protein [Candidatus Lokiarchaeum ossiferum]|uniref:hypothetical protein n=1 Tax=Candidatus Lokiarchaeum ossiferum TaxID=2951803 RepID=UPI00352C7578
MDTSAAGEYFNSKAFIYGLCLGYVMMIGAMIFDIPQMMYGTIGCFVLSFIWWFFELIDLMNKLAGARTNDCIIYRNGLKPVLKKLHIKFIEPLDLDSSAVDMSKIDDFVLEQNDQLTALTLVISKKLEFEDKKSQKKLSDDEKKLRMNKLIKEELNAPDIQEDKNKLWGYRCELIDKFDFPEDQKKQKYSQVVLITKRPFGKEFYHHQDKIRWKNQLVNTSLCYVSLVYWGIAASDTPILYSKFTDIDAYKAAKKVIVSQTISNINSRATASLFFSIKSKYSKIESHLTKKDNEIKDLTNEKNKLEQLNKMATAKKLHGKKVDMKGKLVVSKALFISLVIIIVIGVAALMFIIGKQLPTSPLGPLPTNSTIPGV